MRRLIALSLTFILAACATATREPEATESPISQLPPLEQPSGLNGLTAQDLIGRFGAPALQIREGNSTKLQFRGVSCVLDAYLYPSTGGVLRVTHVDTRLPSGADTDQAACILALRR
jgi:hypothetical protein